MPMRTTARSSSGRHSGSLPTLVEHISRMKKATSYIIDKDSQPTMFPTHQRTYKF